MDDALQSLPVDFVHRLTRLIPPDAMPQITDGLIHGRYTTLRINTLLTTAEALTASFVKQGITLIPVPWYNDAFMVRDTPLRTITDTEEYHTGHIYVQSLSSMIPPLVLAPQPDETVLDIAAAPGSKTTQMAALMGNTGEIIANDTSAIRRLRLASNLKTQGVTNVTSVSMDGRSIWQRYPERFDRVLVDVPCSMEGRFCVTDPKTYEGWSLKKVRDLSLLQRWLLRSGASAVKVGGIIVYSTCTLSPEENEGVVDWLLHKDKSKLIVEDITTPNLPGHQGRISWGDKTYDASLAKSLRVDPTRETEGFFVVRLRKTASMVPPSIRKPVAKPVVHHGPKKVTKRFINRTKRGHKRIS